MQRDAPGPGQESVWDYPRPPRLESVPERITVELGGKVCCLRAGQPRSRLQGFIDCLTLYHLHGLYLLKCLLSSNCKGLLCASQEAGRQDTR